MRIYRSVAEADDAHLRRTVCTLGVFDGVHVGHRHVIRECTTLAVERATESVVVTFVQHPRALIANRAPKLITSIEHRFRLFEALGVDHVLALAFDEVIRETPALDFARTVFRNALDAQIVVSGHNCRFGRGREGDAAFLAEHEDALGLESRRAEEVRLGQRIVSSSTIREAIEKGNLQAASLMLGRPYSLLGTVVHGDARGRTIGFPTANLDPHHELLPPRGVWGAQVRFAGERHYALVNIGVRPTFAESPAHPLVEAHLLDFDGDLYDAEVEVVFLRRIRDERRFSGPDELVAQIRQDETHFRSWLGA